MSDTTTDASTTEAASETSADTSTEATSATEATTIEGEQALGDAGKKALDAMKAKWKTEADARKKLETDYAALQAKIDGKEAEYAAEQAKREAEQSALAKANDRIRRSEVKAAAKGVLADPGDAYKFLDLDSFEVSDDGEVDEAAIAAALKDLVTSKPYLAAQGGQRFQGSADAGTRKETGTKQLTRDDMARMTPEQIEDARMKGQFNDLLNGKS